MSIFSIDNLVKEIKSKILVVDDDPLILDLLQSFIFSLGYPCSIAKDGKEAVEILKENDFTIVITDMIMPQMDGMQLLEHIKKRYPRIDVIVVTGYTGNFSYTDVIKAGASDFISKPFNTDELEAKLKRIIREQSLIHELKYLSICDSLTNLFNRRYFDVKLSEEVHRAHRQDYSVFLALADVDKFKEYNDTKGHQAGDELLQTVGDLMAQCLRKNVDWLFRYGGDEFAIVIPHVAMEQTAHIAERIIESYRENDFAKTSLSIGLARFVRRETNPWRADIADLISRSDKAMYEAKKRGGDMVFCDPA